MEAEWLGDEMSQAPEMNTFAIHLRPSVILTNLLPYTITINTPVSDDADFDLPVLCGVMSHFVLMLSVKYLLFCIFTTFVDSSSCLQCFLIVIMLSFASVKPP